MRARSRVGSCSVAAALLLSVAPLYAQPSWTFSRIADTATPVPEGVGNFFFFDNHPAMDAKGNVAFSGKGRSIQVPGEPPRPQAGVYNSNAGALTRIADTSMLIPGTSERFDFTRGYLGLGVSSYGVSFPGNSDYLTMQGIYDGKGGALRILADRSTLVPTTTSTFTEFNTLHLGRHGSTSAFIGGNNSIQGVYASWGGPLTRVADSTMLVPGGDGGTFSYFYTVGFDGDSVAFSGSEGQVSVGVYRYTWGTLSLIANHHTPVPGGVDTFDNLIGSSIDQGTVVFFGLQGKNKGIYVGDGATVSLVADFNTPLPDGVGTFTEFGLEGGPGFYDYPAISNGAVAFAGAGTDGQGGIYSTLGGTLRKVINLTDPLDGRTLQTVSMKGSGFKNGRIAFYAQFTDGSSGIYVATAAR